MGIKEWIVPQEKKFFDLLERESENVLKAARLLIEMVRMPSRMKEKKQQIRQVEHDNDELVHEIFDRLHETFITPIDREDISSLASLYDSVIDFIYASANRIVLYEITPDRAMLELAEIIGKMAGDLGTSMTHIRDLDEDGMVKARISLHTLENRADDLVNESVTKLFSIRDIKKILKFKEVYEILEQVTDKCEDVSDVMEDVILKGK